MKVKVAALVAAASVLAAADAAQAAPAHGWQDKLKRQVNHMQRVMGWPHLSEWKQGRDWRGHYRWVRSIYLRPPNWQAWFCIHTYEGAWNSSSNAIYDGGLQMDLGFQRHYGGYLLRLKGTADHWTPLEQVWTAERARRSGRGWYPWPHTARMCGLL